MEEAVAAGVRHRHPQRSRQSDCNRVDHRQPGLAARCHSRRTAVEETPCRGGAARGGGWVCCVAGGVAGGEGRDLKLFGSMPNALAGNGP
jgi:hypothetical protein